MQATSRNLRLLQRLSKRSKIRSIARNVKQIYGIEAILWVSTMLSTWKMRSKQLQLTLFIKRRRIKSFDLLKDNLRICRRKYHTLTFKSNQRNKKSITQDWYIQKYKISTNKKSNRDIRHVKRLPSTKDKSRRNIDLIIKIKRLPLKRYRLLSLPLQKSQLQLQNILL